MISSRSYLFGVVSKLNLVLRRVRQRFGGFSEALVIWPGSLVHVHGESWAGKGGLYQGPGQLAWVLRPECTVGPGTINTRGSLTQPRLGSLRCQWHRAMPTGCLEVCLWRLGGVGVGMQGHGE